MPRQLRLFAPDSVVHAVNRGNERRRIFERARDYEEFLYLLDRALERRPTRILGYALMPNHWHLVLWPQHASALSRFLHYLTTCHAARLRYQSGTTGLGHVYQGRFRSTVVDTEVRYVRTMRYVEANPLRADLVQRAEDWPWSSLAERRGTTCRIVDGPFPLPRAADWVTLVNASSGL